MNKILKAALAIILVSVLLITSCFGVTEQEAKIGNRAPNFKLPNLEGQSISLKDFQGKTVLLNFWATWCSPCRKEMPYIQEIFEEWSNRDLVILAINVGESQAKVESFLQSNNLSFPVLLDTKKTVAVKYNIQFYPTTFFIDKDGIIQLKIIGAFPSKAAIEERLSQITP